jgi:hypothetical protein
LPQERPVPADLDLLLLTQGLADHAHPATLERLDRSLPVVASASAAAVCRELGFRRVVALDPGEHHCAGPLRISATPGAAVPRLENGYLLESSSGRVYLEPHGFLPDGLASEPVDLAITPVLDLGLPVAGAFIRGRSLLPRLLDQLRPRVVMASTTGGDVRFTGVLNGLFWARGSVEEASALVAARLPGCELIDPEPGRTYALPTRQESTPPLSSAG